MQIVDIVSSLGPYIRCCLMILHFLVDIALMMPSKSFSYIFRSVEPFAEILYLVLLEHNFGKGDNLLVVPQVKKMIFHDMRKAVCELGMRNLELVSPETVLSSLLPLLVSVHFFHLLV